MLTANSVNENHRDKDSNDSRSKLPRQQKAAVIILSVLGLSVIVFWFWQFKARLNNPFNDGAAKKIAAVNTDNFTLKDTDGDGLNDYDETSTYNTSPYLADSDSDGVDDRQEVETGGDPNCPAGQNCGPLANQSFLTQATSSSSTPPLNTSSSTPDAAGSSATPLDNMTAEELNDFANGRMSAATLRKLLLAGGADKAALDKISDADLLKNYQEMLQAQAAASTSTPPASQP